MKDNVFKYFENLHAQNLSRNKDYFLWDKNQTITNTATQHATSRPILKILGTKYFAKSTGQDYFNNLLSPTEIGSTQMYNDLGMYTPPVYVLEKANPPNNIYLISQDVNSLKGFYATIASKSKLGKITRPFELRDDKQWDLLYNKKVQEQLLECMTPECYEQYIALFLLDEIRTECDRHTDNIFLIRSKNHKKYEGIVPIDNEFAQISYSSPKTNAEFKRFLKSNYLSYTPTQAYCDETFEHRMNALKNLLHNGKLTPLQIALIKKELCYDFPKAIKEGSKHPKLEVACQKASDCMNRIWEYHYSKDGIASELGL